MSTWKEHTSSNFGVQGFIPMPRKFHGWRSLVGYTPWGHKESDTTEWLHFLSFFIKVINCNVQTYSNVLSVWLSLMERYSKTLGAQMVKHLPTMREAPVRSPGQEDPLEKEMATHSSILAWKIPWTEEPGRLQSTGSKRVGHDWATSLLWFLLLLPW